MLYLRLSRPQTRVVWERSARDLLLLIRNVPLKVCFPPLFQKISPVENHVLACSKIFLRHPLQTLMQHYSAIVHFISYTSMPSPCLQPFQTNCYSILQNCIISQTKCFFFLRDIFLAQGNLWLSSRTLVSKFMSLRVILALLTYVTRLVHLLSHLSDPIR